jgi:hypothetical protein
MQLNIFKNITRAIRHFFLLFIFGITACSPGLESSTFNVYVYPDGNTTEISLGQARGLSQCQSMAWAFKNEKKLDNSWGYICCLQTNSSSCASKHK